MKRVLTILIAILLYGTMAQAQNVKLPVEMTNGVSPQIIAKAQKAVNAFHDKVVANYSEFDQPIKDTCIEFETDTFAIETLKALRGGESEGVMPTLFDIENNTSAAYDTLLNKYYKQLYNCLQEEGKEYLKSSQQAWIKFKDLDTDLSSIIYGDNGQLGELEIRMTYSERIKGRTIELFEYLKSIYWKM